MIKLEAVSAGYNHTAQIKEIDLTFETAKITTVVGPNGCGKTTLLKAATRLLKPFVGKIALDGQDIATFAPKEFAKQVAVLPQVRAIPNITVEGLVLHGRFPYLGFPRTVTTSDREMVNRAMELTGVAEMRHKNLLALSGGERQKVYLAMVVAQDSDVIFLDEPTTFLDINHQLEILELMQMLNRQGKTIVMVLHDIAQALSVSHQVCVMQKGSILCCASPQEVFAQGAIDTAFGVHAQVFTPEKSAVKYYYFTAK